MAQTLSPKNPPTAQYTVLRPICMDGARVDVGATVELNPNQYAELAAAGKVGPLVVKAKPKTEEVKK